MDLTAAAPVSSAVRSLCDGFNGFGLDLHRGLPAGGNTFISPLSIGAALAALLPGARGETAAELGRVLRVQGTVEDTARAMAELRGILEPRSTEEESWNDETGAFERVARETFRLSLATGLFVEEAYPLHTAFDVTSADFGGITPHPDGLFLNEAIHQAWLKVDEQGTEAAAATAVTALGGAWREEELPQPVPFVVDRPFYFFIQERLTGAVLFMGRVLDPAA